MLWKVGVLYAKLGSWHQDNSKVFLGILGHQFFKCHEMMAVVLLSLSLFGIIPLTSGENPFKSFQTKH